MAERRRMSFGEVMDKAVVWLVAGLVAWLCISTLHMREQLAVMIERGSNDRQRIERIEVRLQALEDSKR